MWILSDLQTKREGESCCEKYFSLIKNPDKNGQEFHDVSLRHVVIYDDVDSSGMFRSWRNGEFVPQGAK